MRDLLLAAGTFIKKMCIKISLLKEGWPEYYDNQCIAKIDPGRGG